jgi:hypothetical protein
MSVWRTGELAYLRVEPTKDSVLQRHADDLTQFNLITELKSLEDLLSVRSRYHFYVSPLSRLRFLPFLQSRGTSHQIQADDSIREAKSCNDVKTQGFRAAWSIGYKFPNGLMTAQKWEGRVGNGDKVDR